MSIRQAPTGDFDTDLTQLLPRLRVYALSLTRDSVRSDDLVQQTVLRSLASVGAALGRSLDECQGEGPVGETPGRGAWEGTGRDRHP